MSAYPKRNMKDNGKMNDNGKVLISDGDWNLENYDDDDGPVMYHIPCKIWTVELNRKYPQCISCGANIPSSMITPFTLMNWEYANNPEYFVPFEDEDDHYNHYNMNGK